MSETKAGKVGPITMIGEQNRQVVEQLTRAFQNRDFNAMGPLLTEDCVTEFPQSEERIVGRENNVEINRNYPGGLPSVEVLRIIGRDDLWIAELALTYADKSCWYGTMINELRDGQIAKMTCYFGQPFEAPEWRAKYVEKTKA